MSFAHSGSNPTTSEVLKTGIHKLQTDHTNGARILALSALQILHEIISSIPLTTSPFHITVATTLFTDLCSQAWQLKQARPSMDAAIGTALVSALYEIKKAWKEKLKTDVDIFPNPSPSPHPGFQVSKRNLLHVAHQAVQEVISERAECTQLIGEIFANWVRKEMARLGRKEMKILMLSHSSTIKACLLHTIKAIPNLNVELRILESRPGCEGASLAAALLEAIEELDEASVKIQVETDASISLLARDIDFLLLGADRILPSGAVSNKTGSLAAAILAKTLSPSSKTIVISECEKVAGVSQAQEEHKEEENCSNEVSSIWGIEGKWKSTIKTRNVYFEWVGEEWIDGYLMENGFILETFKIEQIAREVERRENEVLRFLKSENQSNQNI